MYDTDGLYLNDIWVATASGIALTLQGNDLTKPNSLQASYTNTFQLPDTIALRELLSNAEQLDSGEIFPYRSLSARIVSGGETLFTGIAELSDFSAGWKVTLYEEKRNLFTRLDRSLRTLSLSRYDHPYTLQGINIHSASTSGICYPLIDYGLMSNGQIPLDSLFPAVYVDTLIREMLDEEGYSLAGYLPNDPLYNRLILPFSESDGTAHDEQWGIDRQANATTDALPTIIVRSFGSIVPISIPGIVVLSFNSIVPLSIPVIVVRSFNSIVPLSVVNLPLEGWSQGKLANFNPLTYTYTCDSAMRLRLEIHQAVSVVVNNGAVEMWLQVEKNGNVAAETYFSQGGPYNLLGFREDSIDINTLVVCAPGDQLRVRFIIAKRTLIATYNIKFQFTPTKTWASFKPDLTVHLGDTWPVARNLPDMTATTLLKGIAQLFGGTWSVNAKRREIRFMGLSETVANTDNAKNWSNRIDTGTEPNWQPRIDGYAQNNYLNWKSIDETQRAGIQYTGLYNIILTRGYGDGVISVDSQTLDLEGTLFELPFAASTNSINFLPGYGHPVRVETRTISYSGDLATATISNKNTAPRLLLVDYNNPQPVPTKVLGVDGITAEDATVTLQPAWFGPRPTVSMRNETAFCLGFSTMSDLHGEQTIIDRYYTGLSRILRRMRVFSSSMVLSPEDIAMIDFGVPIRLNRVQAGSLTLSDGYYILNQIQSYQPGKTASVVLIGF